MAESEQKNILVVQPSEGGQKLLQFLVRRLNLPQTLLHRWLRTGQIRINGGRAKPFVLTKTGDAIRMPPFALSMARSAMVVDEEQKTKQSLLPLPPLVYEDEHLLVFNKPYGLPVHTGTGHVDSLATRLQVHYEQDIFKPTPAHRIDKDTSGIILIARSYACLRALQDAFEQRNIVKEYLAWVKGIWPHDGSLLLNHNMGKRYEGDDERVRILTQEQGRASECIATCLRHENQCSLMHIRLITGRTHQIRVQLAAEGFPVFGDGKYGPWHNHTMRLHALRIILPHTKAFEELNLQGKCFAVLPHWDGWQSANGALDIL